MEVSIWRIRNTSPYISTCTDRRISNPQPVPKTINTTNPTSTKIGLTGKYHGEEKVKQPQN